MVTKETIFSDATLCILVEIIATFPRKVLPPSPDRTVSQGSKACLILIFFIFETFQLVAQCLNHATAWPLLPMFSKIPNGEGLIPGLPPPSPLAASMNGRVAFYTLHIIIIIIATAVAACRTFTSVATRLTSCIADAPGCNLGW
jgi:hypothetical protein